ncbi:MAG TPA: TonB-dependent receptor [Steroidobacteraceae bacterium]|nr:TonB-dependent receptor [Steroidobacteraceae bacterium]
MRRGAFAFLLATAGAHAADATLQEFVVTTTRLPAPRIDVPASVGLVDAGDITRVGATHYSEAVNRIPGVYVQRGGGQESLVSVRSPVLTGAGACGAFLAAEDGLAIRPVGFCNVNDLFEVNTEQAGGIEVLRGPGSAIHGASAVHGIINILTPSVAELPRLGLALEGGQDSYRRVKVATRTPGGTRGFGTYGHYTHDGGFRDDSGVDEGKLNLLYDEADVAGGTLRVRAAGTWLEQESAGYIRGYESYKDEAIVQTNADPEAFRDAWSARGSAAWSRSTCEGCAADVRLIVRRSQMQFLQHFLIGKPLEENAQSSAMVSASTRRPLGAAWSWGAGLDLEASDSDLRETQNGPATDGTPAANAIRPAGKHYDYGVDGRTAGAFATLGWRPDPRWVLNAGLRIERTRYDYDNRMIAGNTDENGVPCGAAGCLYSRPADRVDEFDNVAPKIDVMYLPRERHRLYLSWSRGFRPPEQTELYRLQRQQDIADLDSERLQGGEIGWRAAMGDFDWSLAAFALDKRNVIVRDSSGFNVNGGETTHRGIEYELRWRLSPYWRASAAGSVAWHRYAFSAAVEGGETITDGNDVDTAPRNVHALRIGWSTATNLDAEFEVLHVGRYWLDASNAHEYAGHTLLNLRASWTPAPAWRVTLRALNLADAAYADRADFAFGQYRYFPGRGRTAFVEIAYVAP